MEELEAQGQALREDKEAHKQRRMVEEPGAQKQGAGGG